MQEPAVGALLNVTSVLRQSFGAHVATGDMQGLMDERVAQARLRALESEISLLEEKLLVNGLRLRAIDARHIPTAHPLHMRAHLYVAGANH